MADRQAHWDGIYARKGEREVGWFEDVPTVSLDLIAMVGTRPAAAIVDIGGGSARLVDHLVDRGLAVTVLDLSATALNIAKARLGERAARTRWIVADVTRWVPDATYDLWHDRAAFHFLTDERDRAAYVACMSRALRPGGHAIIAAFAPDGPDTCSGLPVIRYDGVSLSRTLGQAFGLVATRPHIHVTPSGATQSFQFNLFRYMPAAAAP